MKPTLNVELVPFSVPNYVSVKMPPRPRQEGVNLDGPKFHLRELTDETLEMLCRQFREDVFAKARSTDERSRP